MILDVKPFIPIPKAKIWGRKINLGVTFKLYLSPNSETWLLYHFLINTIEIYFLILITDIENFTLNEDKNM